MKAGKKQRLLLEWEPAGSLRAPGKQWGLFLRELEKRNLDNVLVTQTGCMGLCEQEPILEVEIPGQPRISYGKVTAEKPGRSLPGMW